MLHLFHFGFCEEFRFGHVFVLLAGRRGLAHDIFLIGLYDLSGVCWFGRAGIAGNWPKTCLALVLNWIIEVTLNPLGWWLKLVPKVLFVDGRFFGLCGWHYLLIYKAELVGDVINLFGWAGVLDCSLEHCGVVLFVFCEHLTSVPKIHRLLCLGRSVCLQRGADSVLRVWLVGAHKLVLRCFHCIGGLFAFTCTTKFGIRLKLRHWYRVFILALIFVHVIFLKVKIIS